MDRRLFRLNIQVEPIPGNYQTKDIGGALAKVLALAGTEDEAREMALEFISRSGWIAISVRNVTEILPQQIPYLDTQTSAVLKRAYLDGVFGFFAAWPKKPQPGVYLVESLQPPEKKNILQ